MAETPEEIRKEKLKAVQKEFENPVYQAVRAVAGKVVKF